MRATARTTTTPRTSPSLASLGMNQPPVAGNPAPFGRALPRDAAEVFPPPLLSLELHCGDSRLEPQQAKLRCRAPHWTGEYAPPAGQAHPAQPARRAPAIPPVGSS